MVEVPCKFGVSFLQMESEIWIVRINGLHVKMQAGVMRHAMREGVWLAPNVQKTNLRHADRVGQNYLQHSEEQDVLEVMGNNRHKMCG